MSSCKNFRVPLEVKTFVNLNGRSSSVLFAWELGGNYGHLARAAVIGQRLRSEGCEVLVAARDVKLAHSLLTPAGIEFIAAPRLRVAHVRATPAVNYSDLLRDCGYLDRSALRSALRAWIELLQARGPDVVIIDHAPTALLAAKVLNIPRVLIGTGFTIPPAKYPMPPFRTGVTGAELAGADARVLRRINDALKAVGKPRLSRVAELFADAPAIITTFPELDHYPEREHATFVGPVSPPRQLPSVGWPGSGRKRVLAYLNAGFSRLAEVVSALRNSDAEVMCIVPGLGAEIVQRFGGDRFVICNFPVDIGALLPQANLVVTHGGAALTAQALMTGVPLLVVPRFVEQEMSARRVADSGAALVVGAQRLGVEFAKALTRMLAEPSFALAARSLRYRFGKHEPARAVDTIARIVLQVARMRTEATEYSGTGSAHAPRSRPCA